jgi:hypothetical protein
MKCQGVIRFTKLYGTRVGCPREATHAVMACGPQDTTIQHFAGCEAHADRMAKRLLPKDGWRSSVVRL